MVPPQSLLQSPVRIAGTCTHLAQVLSRQDRDSTAVNYLAVWQHSPYAIMGPVFPHFLMKKQWQQISQRRVSNQQNNDNQICPLLEYEPGQEKPSEV